jgi:hypothetical protein
LEEYQPKYLGLDVEKLLSDLETCCAEIMACEDPFPRIEINADLIPEIHLEPPATPRD